MKFPIKKYKFQLLLYIVVSLLILPLESLGFSTFIAQIIGDVKGRLTSKSYGSIQYAILCIGLIWFVTHFLSALRYKLKASNELNFSTEVKNMLFNTYLKKYTQKYEESKVGEVLTNMEYIPALYEKIFISITSKIIPYGFAILCLTIYFFWVHIYLGMASLALTLFVCSSALIFYPKIKKLKILEYTLKEKLNEHIHDRVKTIFDVIANNTQKIEKEKFTKQELTLRNAGKNLRNTTWLFYVSIDIITLIFVISVLCLYLWLFKTYASQQYHKVKLIASFLVFFHFVAYIDLTQMYLVESLIDYSILTYFDNKHKNTEIKLREAKKKQVQKNFIKKGIIIFKNVDFFHGNKQILKNFNSRFNSGVLTGIFGPSGSGKSTIIRIILGIYDISAGSVTIDGVDISEISRDYLSSQIAIVSQNTVINEGTIISNIGFKESEIEKAIKDLEVQSVFENTKLTTKVGVGGSLLSYGQRQIVQILKLHLQNKKINLLDEATSSLDPKNKEIVLKMLHKMKKKGKTVVIISHDRTIIDNVDHKIILK